MSDTGFDMAVQLIAKYEGFEAAPYLCPAKKPTIGYGTTRYPSGVAVTLRDAPCTEAQALEWLKYSAGVAEKAVDRLVTMPVNANQHAALVSFVYNLGATAFSASALLAKLNAGDYEAAACEFLKWDKAGGVSQPGLARRRAEESLLFSKA